MKLFTDADVAAHACVPGAGLINTGDFHKELVYAPLDWQKRGLQETATGYGAKLTMSIKINFNGRLYRLYCTRYAGAGSVWFAAKGRKIFVH